MKQTRIVKQLIGIKNLANKNMDKNPEHFKMLIAAIDEKLEEIRAEQELEIEAEDLSFMTQEIDRYDLSAELNID